MVVAVRGGDGGREGAPGLALFRGASHRCPEFAGGGHQHGHVPLPLYSLHLLTVGGRVGLGGLGTARLEVAGRGGVGRPTTAT